MKQIHVTLKNEPGALSAVCDALEKVGVNIVSLFGGGGTASGGFVNLITEDEESAKKTLEKAGYSTAMHDVLILKMSDKPGELAKVVRKLAFAKVNIDTISLLERAKGETTIAIRVADVKKAKEAVR